MPAKAKKSGALPIGIDVGTRGLKMAQLRSLPNGQYSLVAAAAAEYPSQIRDNPLAQRQFIGETIGEMRQAYALKGRQCILSIPAELTFIQHLKMAKMPADQLTNSLKWELQGKLPFDPAEAIIQYVVAGETYVENDLKQELIVVAAREDIIGAHLEMLRQAKLECVGINVEPCAIVECFARLFRRADDASRATLFVDIGAGSTQVVITHGGRLVFAKNLLFGGDQFDQAVASGMGVAVSDARRHRTEHGSRSESAANAETIEHALSGPLGSLSEELTNCLRYYDSVFVNQPVERVVFLGGEAFNKGLCQTLAQRLALPAQIGDPLAQIGRDVEAAGETGPAAPASRPDWAVAVGLSLGAVIDGDSYRAA